MIILFPIGGTGGRFQKANYDRPKPFIQLGDKRLIDHVLECYPISTRENRHIYVVRSEYEAEFPFGVYTISHKTPGPLATILSHREVVKSLADSVESLLIADCDSLIEREELEEILAYFEGSDATGGVTVRKSDNPAYSYAITNEIAPKQKALGMSLFRTITQVGAFTGGVIGIAMSLAMGDFSETILGYKTFFVYAIYLVLLAIGLVVFMMVRDFMKKKNSMREDSCLPR